MRELWRFPLVRLALAASAMAGAVLGGALWRAIRLDEVRPPTEALSGEGSIAAPSRRAGYPLERVLVAVAKDPFHPERRRPGARFQMPADAAAAVARGQESRATEASLHLIGTAVASDGGGFAMCAWQGGSPHIVRVGERVGDWTLRKVTPGAAVFATPAGATVVVYVPKAGT